MKYDCSKTLDYAHERNRMCDAVKDNDCDNCKLQGVGGSCFHAYLITQEHIDIVQKWSDEHPEKTRKEAFLEMFPKSKIVWPFCFAELIGEKCGEKICGGKPVPCERCWNQPYNGEFEKAREE